MQSMKLRHCDHFYQYKFIHWLWSIVYALITLLAHLLLQFMIFIKLLHHLAVIMLTSHYIHTKPEYYAAQCIANMCTGSALWLNLCFLDLFPRVFFFSEAIAEGQDEASKECFVCAPNLSQGSHPPPRISLTQRAEPPGTARSCAEYQ